MRSRSVLLTLSLALTLVGLACSRKAPSDNANPASNSATNTAADANSANQQNPNTANQQNQAPAPKPPLIVPSGKTVTISLGTSLGSKLSTAGQTFTGSVAKDVVVENAVAIPKGSSVSGTVVDAKPLGRFKGGALLEVRLDSINVNGSDLPVHASARSFTIKGKGKRTGILAGGGAAWAESWEDWRVAEKALPLGSLPAPAPAVLEQPLPDTMENIFLRSPLWLSN